ncbi:UV-damage endonuclease [Natranaerovirga pectinivora]|uniref:UV-damage endonuclease n=1 Tax=Natranaerovirga pectinivora TaxID=682400 RepID=A0A4R3MIP1_9FIRM|nr:UV DNA damage repair endonuclease UvsE [Natranaerovirga pectinivora]TCT12266.1 UV-damage endonuclease [Natranaerovirga pectinivora]
MRIRIGYVAISLNLPKVTSSSTVTFSHYSKLPIEDRLNKLKKVTASNLDDLKTIIEYNIKKNFHFYRMTSKVVPLATHPEVNDWHYLKYFAPDFKIIGDLIKKSDMRVDTHPDQFDVINSHREEVFKSTVVDLMYHNDIFEAMGINHPKMIIHVGGSHGGKELGKERFIKNFRRMPQEIQSKIILENDDKIYNIIDVLDICKALKIPMVLDVHHHLCNGSKEIKLEEYIEEILYTWQNESLVPKIHISSPREHELDRKHSDFINIDDFIKVIEVFKPYNRDFDIMLEAKKKDLALIKLVEDIKTSQPQWIWEDESTLIF